MAACTSCTLCENPGTLQKAADHAQIACNVRHFQNRIFTVWRCSNCNSLHSAEDADLAAFYRHFPLQHHRLDFSTRQLYKKRLRLLQRQGIRKSDRILDYGCGTGVFVEYLREQGYKASGYDPFIPAYADGRVLDESYDVVLTYDVIEHADDPKELIARWAALAKPGGLVLIATPNADHLSLHGNPSDVELSQPYHRHIFSAKALLGLAKKSGLSPMREYPSNEVDTLVPGINTRFMWTYINRMGGVIDVAMEPPSVPLMLRTPSLLFYAFFGYFFPPRGNMVMVFQKEACSKLPACTD